MPALYSMLSGTYYAQNYASIIGRSLLTVLMLVLQGAPRKGSGNPF